MSSIKNNISKFIKGETLFNEEAFKNWRMILFIILLLIIMIRSAHLVDEKVLKVAKLQEEENNLRAEYIALRSKAMKLKLETTLVKRVKPLGLAPSDKPAIVIKEIED